MVFKKKIILIRTVHTYGSKYDKYKYDAYKNESFNMYEYVCVYHEDIVIIMYV